MQHDWTISTKAKRGFGASVHYVSRAETERIARMAKSLDLDVTDGPRPLDEWERLTPMQRAGQEAA